MNLSKLFEIQKELDDHIMQKKGLEGQDLLPQKILALQVELGELANEWRGFKYWSIDQEARHERVCHACKGKGQFTMCLHTGRKEICLYCSGTGIEARPLLEEYVDCLHFYLSIAIQKGWTESMYLFEEAIEDVRHDGLDGGVTGAFLEIEYWLLKSYMEEKRIEKVEKAFGISTKEFYFKNSWFVFVALGIVGFGFALEQIEQAYLDKNKVNHQRQDNGY